jgi:ornithine carbamoyltransferase
MRHLLSLADLQAAEIERIFTITEDLKSKCREGIRDSLLPGRVMALLFEKPSLRTRCSFEAGMIHLGGSSLWLGEEAGWGSRESLEDFGRVLSQYVDVIVVRANRHQTVEELARNCACSIINGLTDYEHPCQALADLYTLRERIGSFQGQTLAYVGDANNVAHSLAMGCGRVGLRLVMATPKRYQFDAQFISRLKAEVPGLDLTVTTDPVEAVREAAAVYTDVWASMGQEAERDARLREFAPYQVNGKLMSQAPAGAWFMHCLPAHRGEEVTDEVMDSPQSIVIEQAANRLHVQKGILAWLLSR